MGSLAAVSLSAHGSPYLRNNSMIFSLIDQSWYSQSILNYSIASLSIPSSTESSAISTAGEESEATLRSSEADSTDGNSSSSGSERTRYTADESEIREVFDRVDENADGLISREELRRWYAKCCGKDVSDSEADSMISCVDRNNDGAVDFEEFLSLYETNCADIEEQEDSNKRARENNDGEEDEEDSLLEAFRVFDRNHDGFISPEELQAVLSNLGMPEGKSLISCEKMIRNVDPNGDGRCDMRAFQKMMSARPF